ncbi:uncharacterized protein LOC123509319 [Portunus trituberculatus]|uniref:uncharacterized protein LOC123509319 n=1 Tax=Portunus trituberculatus TaxID=210409 RepID=UPI001E1CEADC|nr:uncharacterized protein LOC123509319 [Portunus trituberculatus]
MKTITCAILVCAVWLTVLHHAAAAERTQPQDDATVLFRLPCPLSDPDCSSSSFSSFSKTHPEERTNPEEEAEELEEEEEEKEQMEESINCLFSSVPLIGGPWLTEMVRNSFTDLSILQATHSFLLGGKMVSRMVDLGTSSTASRLLVTLERCLEILEPQEPVSNASEGFKLEDSNDLEQRSETEGASDWMIMSPVWSRVQERRKRDLEARLGGYGTDPLVGFNFLGFLVVGALITFLIHMLV